MRLNGGLGDRVRGFRRQPEHHQEIQVRRNHGDHEEQQIGLGNEPDGDPRELGMPPVAVYEVATFYSMYNLEPMGKYKITLCTCLPCGMQGALAAADHLREKLGIDFNETTADGRFTLKEGECMGACAMAPVLLVNNKKMLDYMTNEKLDQLIETLRK